MSERMFPKDANDNGFRQRAIDDLLRNRVMADLQAGIPVAVTISNIVPMKAKDIDWPRIQRLAAWSNLTPDQVMPEEIQALAQAELKRRKDAGEEEEVDY